MKLFYGQDLYLINKNVEQLLNNQPNSDIFTYFLNEDDNDEIISKIINQLSHDSISSKNKIIIINDYNALIFKNKAILEIIKKLINYQSASKTIIIKLFTDNLKQVPSINSLIEIIHVNNCTNQQFVEWIKQKCNDYQIKLPNGGLKLIAKKFPRALMFCDNELIKLANYKLPISMSLIQTICHKFTNQNSLSMIDNWLENDKEQFWAEYRHSWEESANDTMTLFFNFLYQIEMIRNAKLLKSNNRYSDYQIANLMRINTVKLQKLLNYKITVSNINRLLIKAYNLNFLLKQGKINKEIAIVLFFLNN